EIDQSALRKIGTLIQPQRTIASIRHVKGVGRRVEGEPLRLLEPRNSAYDFVFFYIDHADRVVAELRNENALATDIDREMVDAAADIAQRNLGLQHEGRRIHGPRCWTDQRQQDSEQESRQPRTRANRWRRRGHLSLLQLSRDFPDFGSLHQGE